MRTRLARNSTDVLTRNLNDSYARITPVDDKRRNGQIVLPDGTFVNSDDPLHYHLSDAEIAVLMSYLG
jgi:hypothetical protein